MMSEDSELLDILTKIIFVIIILIVGIALFVVTMVNKNSLGISKVEQVIKNNGDLIVLVRKNKCSKCSSIEKVLKDNKIDYYVLNSNNDKRKDIIYKKINITNIDIVEPSIIYIKDGNLNSILVDIKKISDLNSFLEYNSLTN